MFTFIILCDFISYQEEENNKGTEYILYSAFPLWLISTISFMYIHYMAIYSLDTQKGKIVG